MAVEDHRRAIEVMCSRLRSDLEAQLTVLASEHADALAGARLTAEVAAEARWAAKLDEIQTEWSAHLEAEIARKRGEAEVLSRALAETTLVADERGRQRDEFRAELERTRAALLSERTTVEELRAAAACAEARAAAPADDADALRAAAAAERQSQLALVARLLAAVRSLDAAASLSRLLTTLMSAVALEVPRAVLFVFENGALKPWQSSGFAGQEDALNAGIVGDGLLAQVWQRRQTVTTSDIGPAAPAFARLPKDRAAIGVPLIVGGQPVAIVYADDAGSEPRTAPASWPEVVQILCRHASIGLAHLTFARAAETLRRAASPPRARIASVALPGNDTALLGGSA